MDQKKTGAFLAQLRKEKHYTQMQLADLLGVTNKTISRWETGAYMPDLSTLPMLCAILDVSINEFLAGERLNDDTFRHHAEQNMVHIINREEKLMKKKTLISALGGSGTGMLISAVYSPASITRTVVVIAAIALILFSWILQEQLYRNLSARQS